VRKISGIWEFFRRKRFPKFPDAGIPQHNCHKNQNPAIEEVPKDV
jgi:hypothetical protein